MRSNECRNRAALALALLLALAALLASAAWAKEAADWRIRVKTAACVKGQRVLLGEIAEAVGETPKGLWDKLARLELWSAPRQGRVVTLTRDELGRLLKNHLGEVAQRCVLPVQLQVQGGGVVFDSQALSREVVAFLTQRTSRLEGEAELKDVQVPPALFLQAELDTLEIVLAGEIRPGRVPLLLLTKGPDGRILSRAAASVFMNLWRAVPCAARPINRNEPLTPERVTFQRKNLAYADNAWDGKGGPFRVLRSVPTGQPITMDNLEPLPLVVKGEKILLVYQGKGLHLAVKALALADGGMGSSVAVRNLQSNKVVLATVVDKDTVVVR